MNDFTPSKTRIGLALTLLGALLLTAPPAAAMSGTSQVALPGKPVAAVTGWPEGVLELVNDPLRTTGSNPWFSEMSNDVNFYGFEVRGTDDVNRLIQKLAAIKAPKLQVQLNPGREATYLGYSTVLKKGNGTAVVFSVSNQETLNAWYQRLPEVEPGVRKIGKWEFKEPPVAKPPTLTIYIGHDAIDLKKLNIPQAVEVSLNTLAAAGNATPDSAVLKAIDDFVAQHNKVKASKPANPQSGVTPSSP